MSENKKATQEQDLGEQVRIRREKLMELQQNGQDPFAIVKYDVTHHIMEIKGAYDQLEGTVVVLSLIHILFLLREQMKMLHVMLRFLRLPFLALSSIMMRNTTAITLLKMLCLIIFFPAISM